MQREVIYQVQGFSTQNDAEVNLVRFLSTYIHVAALGDFCPITPFGIVKN
ncbi:MAG: hypothetical protein II453_03935 [Alphaproteobacteria bacterium]|nr:hypothetical protein [Alphaproteobacteria bacterium]